jgi:hypothetical protein
MNSTEKEFSIKKPGALLWDCGVSHADIVSRLHSNRIDRQWLICPHGEASLAKKIAEVPIDNLDELRRSFRRSTNSPHSTEPISEMEKFDSLERLAKLREQGVLTEDEFVKEKTKILEAPQSPVITRNQFGNVAKLQTSSTGAADAGVSPAVIVSGYIFAFLIPIVSIILGIITLTSGSQTQKAHGIANIAISVVVMLLYLSIMSGGS